MGNHPQEGDLAGSLSVALISDVFFDRDPSRRLGSRLEQARELGADLVLLPELPLNPWSPAKREPRKEDAEPPKGERHRLLSQAARKAGIGLLGGAIVRDPDSGKLYNTALLFQSDGELAASYRKMHPAWEEGFWERNHFEPGDRPPSPIEGFPLVLGIQICSDVQRPEGCHILGAAGVEAILAPRATHRHTWERWKTVYLADAITSATHILTVNRPGPELDGSMGGPSLAVGPDGEVLCETMDPVAVVTLKRSAVVQARKDYPGYLAIRSDLYARGWSGLMEENR